MENMTPDFQQCLSGACEVHERWWGAYNKHFVHQAFKIRLTEQSVTEYIQSACSFERMSHIRQRQAMHDPRISSHEPRIDSLSLANYLL